MAEQRRLVVIGGGPMGLEMAVAAVCSGWHVRLVERGEVAANVKRWAHVRLFSAWELNYSPAGCQVLEELGLPRPPADAFPTGEEFVKQYLAPMAQWLVQHAQAVVECSTEVLSIGRAGGLLKADMGAAIRQAQPFRVLVGRTDGTGEERVVEADAVVDASGTYGRGNFLGMGGVPALGERRLDGRVLRTIPNVAADPDRWLGKTTVVVGAGYSAITTINQLRELSETQPTGAGPAHPVRVVWATRRASGAEGLYERILADPLPQRDRLCVLANELTDPAASPSSDADILFAVQHLPRAHLIAMRAPEGDQGPLQLEFLQSQDQGDAEPVEVVADNLIANVGYRPQTSIFQELQVHQCYASEGPMKLAAALLSSSGAGSADCLAQEAPGPGTMVNPEPRFFIIGMKSYGRGSKFLLKIGLEQVAMVLSLLDEQ